jgi:hypothetical protein
MKKSPVKGSLLAALLLLPVLGWAQAPDLNGINRPDSKKRTASSAQNAQDVDI